MNPNDPNVSLLERAAEQVGEALLEQLVFVGGAVAGVLISSVALSVAPLQGPGPSGSMVTHCRVTVDPMALVSGMKLVLVSDGLVKVPLVAGDTDHWPAPLALPLSCTGFRPQVA